MPHGSQAKSRQPIPISQTFSFSQITVSGPSLTQSYTVSSCQTANTVKTKTKTKHSIKSFLSLYERLLLEFPGCYVPVIFPLLANPVGTTNPVLLQNWLRSLSTGDRCGGEYQTKVGGILRESISLSQFFNTSSSALRDKFQNFLGGDGYKSPTAGPSDPFKKKAGGGPAGEIMRAVKANLACLADTTCGGDVFDGIGNEDEARHSRKSGGNPRSPSRSTPSRDSSSYPLITRKDDSHSAEPTLSEELFVINESVSVLKTTLNKNTPFGGMVYARLYDDTMKLRMSFIQRLKSNFEPFLVFLSTAIIAEEQHANCWKSLSKNLNELCEIEGGHPLDSRAGAPPVAVQIIELTKQKCDNRVSALKSIHFMLSHYHLNLVEVIGAKVACEKAAVKILSQVNEEVSTEDINSQFELNQKRLSNCMAEAYNLSEVLQQRMCYSFFSMEANRGAKTAAKGAKLVQKLSKLDTVFERESKMVAEDTSRNETAELKALKDVLKWFEKNDKDAISKQSLTIAWKITGDSANGGWDLPLVTELLKSLGIESKMDTNGSQSQKAALIRTCLSKMDDNLRGLSKNYTVNEGGTTTLATIEKLREKLVEEFQSAFVKLPWVGTIPKFGQHERTIIQGTTAILKVFHSRIADIDSTFFLGQICDRIDEHYSVKKVIAEKEYQKQVKARNLREQIQASQGNPSVTAELMSQLSLLVPADSLQGVEPELDDTDFEAAKKKHLAIQAVTRPLENIVRRYQSLLEKTSIQIPVQIMIRWATVETQYCEKECEFLNGVVLKGIEKSLVLEEHECAEYFQV